MANSHDWLKANHEELYDQSISTYTYLQDYTNRDRMGFGSATTLGQWFDTEFVPRITAFHLAFTDWKEPSTRSPLKTEKLKDEESKFRPKYRQLYT
ncbi:MAG: hypothetical protein LBK06_04165, partial [Planctomycetaceae bacterium]|nr:hypothetical protein [Planctomycetaceae bacterium]